MSFTTREVTHRFRNADGTAASGSITFWLTKRMSQIGETLVPAEITANLTEEGALAQSLTANNDTGTVPGDAQWRVDMRVLGAEQEQFFITVPAGSGPIDLMTLLPQQSLGG